MGLDYSIEARITNFATKEAQEFELAYWRKCYGLRNFLQEIAHDYANNTDGIVEDDYLTICNSDVVEIVIRKLLEKVGSDGFEWDDSIWSALVCKETTLNQLKRLIAFNRFIYLLNMEEKSCDVLDDLEDISRYTYIEIETLREVLDNPHLYNVEILFYNSY